MPERQQTPWKRYLLLGALAMALGQAAYSVFLGSVEPDAPDPAGAMERMMMGLMAIMGTIGVALGSVLYARSAPVLSRRDQVDRTKGQQFLVELIATVGLTFATTFLGWGLLGLFRITGDSSLPAWERLVAVPLALVGSVLILGGILLWHLWLRRPSDPFSRASVARALRDTSSWQWWARPAQQWDPASKRDVWAVRSVFWCGLLARAIGAAYLGSYLTNNLTGRPGEDIIAILGLIGVVSAGGLLVALPNEVLPERGISRARKLLEASLDNGIVVLGGGFFGAFIGIISTQNTPLYGVIVLGIYFLIVIAITGWFNSSLLAYRNWHDPEVERRKRQKASPSEEEVS